MHLSQAEIQKMKKNMRKVPVIQEKSERYHEVEDKEADQFINEQLHNEQWIINKEQWRIINNNKKIPLLKRIKNRIQNKIKKLYTLKQKKWW